MTIQLPEHIAALFQVIASIVILIVSIVVNGSKFGERAEKMHSCALELNSLTREVEAAVHQEADEDRIKELRDRYDRALSRFENHTDTDFLIAKIRREPEHYKIKWHHRMRADLEYYGGFLPYVALILGGAFLLYILVRPI